MNNQPFIKLQGLKEYRCDNCGKIAGGAQVTDYADMVCRIMLPHGWAGLVDTMTEAKRQFITFHCETCKTIHNT